MPDPEALRHFLHHRPELIHSDRHGRAKRHEAPSSRRITRPSEAFGSDRLIVAWLHLRRQIGALQTSRQEFAVNAV
jgi:hypothetical protein